jgi:molybdate transport system substrate-binding protein
MATVDGRLGRSWRGIHALLAVWVLGFAPHVAAVEIVVCAAASLSDAFREIGKAFEAAHPGVTIAFNFAASDVLATQIAKGAPADVFASADEEAMNRAERDRVMRSATRRNFVSNRLVLIVPAKAGPIESLRDLAEPAFKGIALGSPQTVPAGRYARRALEQANLWTRLSERFVFATNVRQALEYVARGETEAGFVYVTDAAVMPNKVRIAFEVPTPTAIRYPIAVTAASREPALAQSFVEFLSKPPMQQVLVRYGFGLPAQP